MEREASMSSAAAVLSLGKGFLTGFSFYTVDKQKERSNQLYVLVYVLYTHTAP
jgi:hypothetical protein